MVHRFASLFKLLIFACALGFASAAAELDPLSDAFIDLINSKQTTWRAGRNFPDNTPLEYLENLNGVLRDDSDYKLPSIQHNADLIASLPENFDPREKWTNCPSLSEIRDQGACGSCWVFGAVEAMTDRVCIYSNGTRQFHFSAEDLLTCCDSCGSCRGGSPIRAWKTWVHEGLVSGGNYGSKQGCRPYSIAPCEHSVPGDRPHCFSNGSTPKCVSQCEVGYKVSYNNDKQYGKKVYTVDGEDNIMADLFTNGPLETGFEVYADFLHYRTGVYHYENGPFLGMHAVKMMGWGVENGTKYWLIANSWNDDWGDHGYFKFLRGENHCGIEDSIIAGVPKL